MMPNHAITKTEFDLALEPINRRLTIVEANNTALGLQVAEFKGGMDKALLHVEKQIKDAGERNDRHAIKLEELFIKYSEQLKEMVESGLAAQKHEIEKINDVFDIGGHSDNAFAVKTFMRAIREERKEREDGQLDTRRRVRSETIALLYKILTAIIISGGSIIGTLFMVGLK